MQGTIHTTWRHGDPSITQAFMSKGLLNVSFDSVRKRIKEKVAKHDVTKAKPQWRKGKPVTVNGVNYESTIAASEKLNISVDTLRSKIRIAKSRTITLVRTYRMSDLAYQEIMVDGVVYSDIHTASYKLKVSASLLLSKINKAQSFTIAHRVRKNSTAVVIDGVKYDSVIIAVQRTGLTYAVVKRIAIQQNAT